MRDTSYLIGNQFAKGQSPNRGSFKKGCIPWNKGKTKGDDSRIGNQGKGTWFPKGNKPPGYRGGRMSSKGYDYILMPEHPKANSLGYVAKHILVWQEANGMSLPDGYVVHHINGIKNDNRLGNLLALPRRGHSPSLTVKEVQKRLREIEAKLAQRRLNEGIL